MSTSTDFRLYRFNRKIAKQSLNTTNIKSTTSYQTSYRQSAYVTPKSPRVAKSDFVVFDKNKSQL